MSRLVLGSILVSLTLLLAACGGTTQPSPPTATEDYTYIVITPGALLLTEAGDTVQLSATVYDTSGQATGESVTWHSSDPGVVSVSAEGLATATAALGSAQIVARAEGVESAPVLAVIAEPVAGAILVSDKQVFGEFTPVDPVENYGLGWRYRVTLRDLPLPDSGSVLLGTGEVPVGGRVVAAEQVGDTVQVTLELIAIDEMFAALVIDEEMDLSEGFVADLPQEIKDAFVVERLDDGTWEFTSKDDSFVSEQVLSTAQSDGKFKLGPFACKAEGTFAPLQINSGVKVTFQPNIAFNIHYDSNAGAFQVFAVSGTPTGKVKTEFKTKVALEGKIDCLLELAEIRIPAGMLGLFFGGTVPLGVGVEMNGKVTVLDFGLDVEATAKADFALGFECVSGPCTMINSLDFDGNGKIKPNIPSFSQDLKVDLRVHGFGYAKLKFGNPWITALQFETLEARFGPAQFFDLATKQVQVANVDYASNFRLSLYGIAKATQKFDTFLKWLKVSFAKIEVSKEIPLAESPKGTFTITPASVKPNDDTSFGDLATLKVTLDPVIYAGFDSVEKVEFFWKKDDGSGGSPLEPLGNERPSCGEVAAFPGQTTFEYQTYFLQEHAGEQTFYAFVHAKLFGVPVPVPLEISKDAKAKLTVGDEKEGENGALDLSGTWDLLVDGVCPGLLEVQQTGVALAVSGSVGGGFCPFSASGSGSGELADTLVQFGLAFGKGQNDGGSGLGSITFEGTTNSDGRLMSGTYSGDRSGTWTATKK